MDLYGSLVANEGSGGGGGGTADVPIKSISVNGSGVAPVNKNVNIDVPTKTSDLTNDSNFASTSDIPTKVSELDNDSNFASTSDIPTKVSELQNDSKFVTEDDLNAKGYASTSDIPTKNSQLTNDSKFVTETALAAKNYADKTYVGEQIAQSEHLKREIVDVLPEPTVADEHTIYMLKDDSVKGSDKFKEYMLIEGVVQCVGDTSVDLTDYVKTAELPTELPANGGNSNTVNNHTVESDVPVDAKFTDTIYDDTEVKEGITNLNSNLGVIGKCKNLLKPTLQTTTQNGVTCTANGDGTYTINGTSTKDRWISFGTITLKPGKYKFIATENNVEVSNLCVSLNQTMIARPGNIFIIQSKCVCNIGLSTMDKTFNNVLIKLMITTNLSATYDDFVPYTGDGETLTHDVAEIKKDLGDLILSASGTTLTITDGTNTWTLEANK